MAPQTESAQQVVMDLLGKHDGLAGRRAIAESLPELAF
jgi:hypothetical protein